MKVHTFFTVPVVALLMSLAGNSQTIPEPPPPPEPGTETPDSMRIFEKVEVEASFPGGDNGWRRYLELNLNASTPVDNGAPAGTYTVWIQFIVDKNGAISEIKALTKLGYGMEAEVMRIIRKSPPWSPAIYNGRAVKAYRKQPVTFMVIEEKRKRKKNRDN